MTTDSCKNGATTWSRMRFSGYVGHVTIFSLMLTIACCLVVGSGLGLDLACGWLVVLHSYLYYIIIVIIIIFYFIPSVVKIPRVKS